MFLNDAVDEDFDRRYRPERPIVASQISSRSVWVLSCLWLGAGLAALISLGKLPTLMAVVLLLTIVLYDVVHKRTRLAPVLMAACRFWLYLVAASAVGGAAISRPVWPAVALAVYILGLSYLARTESTGARSMTWTVVLLFFPAVHALFSDHTLIRISWVVIVQIAWIGWCLYPGLPNFRLPLARSVSGLLAGIALVDWLAATGYGAAGVFPGLFLLALLLQRIAPAT
jgi:4-hydroxybenzoate polyprenyltransferase